MGAAPPRGSGPAPSAPLDGGGEVALSGQHSTEWGGHPWCPSHGNIPKRADSPSPVPPIPGDGAYCTRGITSACMWLFSGTRQPEGDPGLKCISR